MKSKHIIYKTASFKSLLILGLLCLISITGCKKYLEIPLPTTKIAGEGAYVTDRVTAASLGSIYAGLSGSALFDGTSSIGFTTGLYTDELQHLNPNLTDNVAFYSDLVSQAQTSGMWNTMYKQMYNINAAIEGITASTGLVNKNQWLGEAYFLRAFCYFHMVNYYGDVPLVTSTDFLVNKNLSRSPKADVYKLIIADLLQAQSMLSNEYKDAAAKTTTIKGRPNKHTVTALLARAYLYTGDWPNAEIQSNNVITATIGAGTAYTLLPAADIDKVFLAASAETIFALVPNGTNVRDFGAYNNNMLAILPGTNWLVSGISAALSTSLLDAFEKNTITLADDRRKTYWVRSTTRVATPTVPEFTYYYPNKYKAPTTAVGTEYIVLFRLAEQYLIRAEARARLNNLDGAKTDIDLIRTRAGLTGTTATSQVDLINAVLKERRIEFFAEEGHRFFDLKRTGTIDAVMNIIAPLKGTTITWNSLKQYFPIPAYDISVNGNLIQTPGYQ